MIRIIEITHALRLRRIDLLREMPIEKGIIYIKLTNDPLVMECNAKNNTEGEEIYHRTKSLVKVNT